MTRKITTHHVNGLNKELDIEVLDEPGMGNASHEYHVKPVDLCTTNLTTHIKTSQLLRASTIIRFQKGPINQHGINGISNEALLAVVRDRLECFQSGPFACEENAQALAAVIEAMDALHSRTKDRLERGVEGTLNT